MVGINSRTPILNNSRSFISLQVRPLICPYWVGSPVQLGEITGLQPLIINLWVWISCHKLVVRSLTYTKVRSLSYCLYLVGSPAQLGDITHLLFTNNKSSRWEHNLLKLTHLGETKNRAHGSQIVSAKENLKMSNAGPSQRQASGTNQLITALRQCRH